MTAPVGTCDHVGFAGHPACAHCGFEDRCPKCRAVKPIGARTCAACGWGWLTGTLNGFEPSQRAGAPTPGRGKEIAATEAGLNTTVVACLADGERLEQHLRDAKVLAVKLGALTELQTGRLAVATRDARLAELRRYVSELATRLEHSAWTT